MAFVLTDHHIPSPSVFNIYMLHIYLYYMNVILYSQYTNIFANNHVVQAPYVAKCFF
jgi:hypothetical protein